MKQTLRELPVHIGLFAVLLALLCAFLVISASIDNDRLADNFTKSALSYQDSEAFEYHDGRQFCAIGDNYADVLWLGVGWNMGEYGIWDTGYYDGEAYGETYGLYQSVTEHAEPNTDYTRYWHGTAGFIRLLHLFGDVTFVKTVGFIGILLFAVWTLFVLIRRGHVDLAALLALSLCAVHVWNLRLSMEYQPAFLICFALCPVYLGAERKSDAALRLVCTAAGILTAFFDFLTTETVTLLLPLALVTTVRIKEDRLDGFGIKDLFFCGVCWLAAYLGTFAAKWCITAAVTGKPVLQTALAAADTWAGSGSELAPDNIFVCMVSAIAANLTVLFGGTARVQIVRVLIGLVLFAAIYGSCWYLFGCKKPARGTKLLLLIGSMVLLRYLVLCSHAYVHEFFTYRALIAPIFALFAVLRLSVPQKKRRKK